MVKGFSGRGLSLFLAWEIAALMLLAGVLPSATVQDLGFFVFYFLLVAFLLATTLALGFLRNRKAEVQGLFEVQLPGAAIAIAVGGVATFFILLFALLPSDLRPLPLEFLLLQALVVAPAEEFSFRYLLPRTIPDVGPVPAWVLAQVTFALFHFRAFNLDIWSMALAFLFGVAAYGIVALRSRSRIFGLGFMIGAHFVWNVMVLAVSGSVVLTGFLA